MRRRFFVAAFEGERAAIEGETAHHLGRVLRAQVGQLYELSDGKRVWLGRVESVQRERVNFALLQELPAHALTMDVTLLLAIVKFDAFEWAIEKATELGVSAIVPLAAARSEKALLSAAGKRAERWEKIITEAAQQSRRLRPPVLRAVTTPEKTFLAPADDAVGVMLSERASALPLRKVLKGYSGANAVLAVGPEGGWIEEEFGLAAAGGFREASCSGLILRTETAVISGLAMLNYALGTD